MGSTLLEAHDAPALIEVKTPPVIMAAANLLPSADEAAESHPCPSEGELVTLTQLAPESAET